MIGNVALVHAQDSTIILHEVEIHAIGADDLWYLKQAKSLAAKQLLDSGDIDRLHALQLGELIQHTSGSFVKDYGGVGGLKTVSVRSLGANHTGVYMNGMRVNDIQSGVVDLGRLDVTTIEEASLSKSFTESELLPASALRVAAVLQLQTNALSWIGGKKFKGEVSATRGSFGLSRFAGIGGARVGENSAIKIGLAQTNGKGNYPFQFNNVAKERSNADITSSLVTIQYDTQLKKGHLASTIRYYSSNRGLPSAIIDSEEEADQRMWNDDFSAQASYQHELSSKIEIKVFGSYAQQWQRYIDPSFLNSSGGLDNRFLQRTTYGAAAYRIHVSNHFQLVGATDLQNQELLGGIENSPVAGRVGFFQHLGLKWGKGKVNVEARGLFEHFKSTDSESSVVVQKLNPAIALGVIPFWKVPLRIRASYQRTLRLPTFSDLYFFTVSNPDLVPENADQYNLGMVYSLAPQKVLDRVVLTVDGYYIHLEDKIVAVPTQNLGVWSVMNIGEVVTNGVDFGAQLLSETWQKLSARISLNYTLQKALDMTNEGGPTYRHQIPYTPQEIGNALAAINYKWLTVSWSYLFSGYSYVLGENIQANSMDGWSTSDVAIDVRFNLKNQRFSVFWKANNINDVNYQVIRGFPMPGRNFQLGLKWSALK